MLTKTFWNQLVSEIWRKASEIIIFLISNMLLLQEWLNLCFISEVRIQKNQQHSNKAPGHSENQSNYYTVSGVSYVTTSWSIEQTNPLKLVQTGFWFCFYPTNMLTMRTKCFIQKKCSGSHRDPDSLSTVPYPLAQLCSTVGNFKWYLCGLAKANKVRPREAIVPTTTCCATKNYSQT